MRIALCISGQPRVVRSTFDNYIKANLFDVNSEHQIDTFVHTWFDNADVNERYINAGGHLASDPIPSTVIQDIQELYNPVKMLVEKQVIFDELDYNDRKMPGIIPFFSLSKMNSIYRADQLRQAYQKEQHNTLLYDGVISFRFDMALEAPFIFDEALAQPSGRLSLIHPVGCPHPESINVIMTWTSTPIAMNIYAELVKYVDDLYREDGIVFCDEPLAYAHMRRQDVECFQFSISHHLARN